MGLTSKMVAQVVATHTAPLDLGVAKLPVEVTKVVELASGTGAGGADLLFSDTRPLGPSANEDLDLAGVLLSAFGVALTFVRVKALYIAAAAANLNNIVVGAAAATPWATLLNSTGTVTLRPGSAALFVAGAADSTAWAVAAGTGDLLRVTNAAGVNTVNYDIVVIGASA